jgi:L-threonylcarbamoyladenylate synthase
LTPRLLQAHDPDAVDAAAAELGDGQVIVVPTDTVYGLAARPDKPDAVQAIYRAKGRPDGLPLPVLAASLGQVRQLGVELSASAVALAERWWPGPLTMALGFAPGAARPPWLDGRDEVAVRIPDHPYLRALMTATGVLLVTSANSHGEPTPVAAAQAAASVGSTVRLVIDGGLLTEVPSTLVNTRAKPVVVERVGVISAEQIAASVTTASEPQE